MTDIEQQVDQILDQLADSGSGLVTALDDAQADGERIEETFQQLEETVGEVTETVESRFSELSGEVQALLGVLKSEGSALASGTQQALRAVGQASAAAGSLNGTATAAAEEVRGGLAGVEGSLGEAANTLEQLAQSVESAHSELTQQVEEAQQALLSALGDAQALLAGEVAEEVGSLTEAVTASGERIAESFHDQLGQQMEEAMNGFLGRLGAFEQRMEANFTSIEEHAEEFFGAATVDHAESQEPLLEERVTAARELAEQLGTFADAVQQGGDAVDRAVDGVRSSSREATGGLVEADSELDRANETLAQFLREVT